MDQEKDKLNDTVRLIVCCILAVMMWKGCDNIEKSVPHFLEQQEKREAIEKGNR